MTITPEQLARALALDFPVNDVAAAVHSSFARLTAFEMTTVLTSVYADPPLTSDQLAGALAAAGYSPAPPSGVRREGPAGHPNGDSFDDTDAVSALGGSISRIVVHASDIVDGLQTFVGDAPLPLHGGAGGAPTTVDLAPDELLVEVSGHQGTWFGQSCIVQLSLRTRSPRGETNHGPFGTMAYAEDVTPFRFMTLSGRIVAFLGHDFAGAESDGSQTRYLAAIGVAIAETD